MPGRKKSEPEKAPEGVRLQAYLARAGVASRRACEELIREGRVTVDGRRAEIGDKIVPAEGVVRVDGRPVKLLATEWIALHKPRGYVTTRDDPEGRRTIYELLPGDLHHLFHVGRLDRSSSGLLLLTNDGGTANLLLHPRYGTTKEYVVDVEGEPSDATLRRLVDGVQLADGIAHAVSVELRDGTDADVHRLVIVLREGKNREVRRMLEAVGHPVRRLFRRAFGPLEIGGLPPGRWRRLTLREIQSLRGSAPPPTRGR